MFRNQSRRIQMHSYGIGLLLWKKGIPELDSGTVLVLLVYELRTDV
jgi:hypothetical protein